MGLLALLGYVVVYAWPLAFDPIRSDAVSYYVYLPSTFLYGDPSLAALADDFFGGAYPPFTAIERWPSTGRWVNPHPMGVAVLTLPFFALAHGLTRWSNFPPDGFSFYYQHLVGLAGLAYVVAGLALLRRQLDDHFSKGVVVATIVCLTWGTNLFHYATYDSAYSHAFAFFLICALLSLTPRWHESASRRLSLGLGAVIGLVALVRHTNLLFVLPFLLWGANGVEGLSALVRRLWEGRRALGLVGLTACGVVVPQLALYRWSTGLWLPNPYGPERGFDFASPRLLAVLFGTEKGLFFWSPLLLVAVAGFVVLPRALRPLRPGALLALALQAYLVSSWYDWQFGGSYGHRAFTDGLGVLAFPLGAVFAWAAGHRGRLVVVAPAALLFTALSIVQMVQYWLRIIPFSDTTWDLYREVFLRLRP